MKKFFLLFNVILCLNAVAQKKADYAIAKTYHIASPGGWDYLAVNDDKLYVSHGTQVNIS
jgi:hypothetical protein